ncbi:hypothetical protein, unlikely [Trypanosoma brucei gambiense DAL972]|uniref:Uncharacterized protein n=1 Tax=Trypanosoma brucei gambiense (strain MHOM/CI/86/DAL972) TaxID=679716 RepID=C9ZIY5_TRYB9|nr:hypothetical protein, unlikely [Trypanosoma brucei gambiense DAL972]CBH09313.1 hypothetical protein, unlikely [Trypanosoma brucei gambiense DAL972]|eukprot:XP_011771621.1 hypothetical protein, unlikely [Trypanosoma brucei gambiense DAL972]
MSISSQFPSVRRCSVCNRKKNFCRAPTNFHTGGWGITLCWGASARTDSLMRLEPPKARKYGFRD